MIYLVSESIFFGKLSRFFCTGPRVLEYNVQTSSKSDNSISRFTSTCYPPRCGNSGGSPPLISPTSIPSHSATMVPKQASPIKPLSASILQGILRHPHTHRARPACTEIPCPAGGTRKTDRLPSTHLFINYINFFSFHECTYGCSNGYFSHLATC